MKKLSKVLSIIICAALMFVSSIPAFADTADQATLDARNGVVKVFAYVNDTSTIKRWGTGFLINEDTIVTAAHLIEDTKDEKITKVTVVAVADIEIEAKKLSVSGQRDFAVLKLDQKINQRAVLPLGTPNGFDATSNVYALGFPYVKEYASDKINYSPADVVVTGGKVSSINTIGSVKYVQHSAKLDNGNSGGPLVYSTGSQASVVGVNVASLSHNDSTYYYSVQIDEIIEALDTLGIKYTSMGSAVPAAPSNGSAEVTSNPDTSKPSAFNLSKNAIIGIVAAVAVIIVVIIVILILSNSKKKSSAIPVYNSAPAPVTTGNFNGGDTTTLLSDQGSDPNATTVLGTAGTSAHLVRLSNGEKITISKPLFKLGKDSTRVDYCITGNSAISRYHAAVISRDGKFFIEDQGATNHTYVNEQEIPAKAETQLVNGAKIRLANENFEFRI